MDTSFSPKRVLIVDDNREAADLIAQLFEIHGHVAMTAYNGQQGVQKACEFHPNVILMDLAMPVMDGYDAALALRKNPDTSEIVLVALTAWGDPTVRNRTRAHGFDHHVVKPANFHILLDAVNTERLQSSL